MFRRAVGSLLARRFSPRATPPARSLHSLRDLPIGQVLDGAAVFTAAALTGAGGTLAIQYFMKGLDGDESGARKMAGASKEVTDNKVITGESTKLDMKERFEHWTKKHNKRYRDEEEKAMRFQVFKDTVEWMESEPLWVQKKMFPEIGPLADFTEQEWERMLAFPKEADRIAYREMEKVLLAKYEKGESLEWRPDVKQGKPAVKQGKPAVKQGKPAVKQDDMRAKVST